MNRKKISIAVPYKQRARNLRIMLLCLANQENFSLNDLEIVVGAMELSSDLLEIVRAFPQLDIVLVVTGRSFEIPSARNLAIRQCTGEVTLHVDADTALAPNALSNLYNRHFRFGQNVCVVGQMIGYGNNAGEEVKSVEALTYDDISEGIRAFESGDPLDSRFTVPHLIPWAFTWTGLVAVPTDYATRERLYFDETFRGWGVDDLEWGFRVAKSGLPIILDKNVVSLNLPHIRYTTDNRRTEAANYRRFLKKWPCLEVELSSAIGDVEANHRYGYFATELDKAFGNSRHARVVNLRAGNNSILVVGADPEVCSDLRSATDIGWSAEMLELSGLSLPFDDGQFDFACVSTRIDRLPSDISALIRAEAVRTARHVKSFNGANELHSQLAPGA